MYLILVIVFFTSRIFISSFKKFISCFREAFSCLTFFSHFEHFILKFLLKFSFSQALQNKNYLFVGCFSWKVLGPGKIPMNSFKFAFAQTVRVPIVLDQVFNANFLV